MSLEQSRLPHLVPIYHQSSAITPLFPSASSSSPSPEDFSSSHPSSKKFIKFVCPPKSNVKDHRVSSSTFRQDNLVFPPSPLLDPMSFLQSMEPMGDMASQPALIPRLPDFKSCGPYTGRTEEPATRWLSRYEWEWESALGSSQIPPDRFARGIRVCF